MNKRKIIIMAAVFVVLLAAFAILLPYLISKPIGQTLNADFSKIDKVIMVDGTNAKCCTLTDKTRVKIFLEQFDGVNLKKSFNQRGDLRLTLQVSLYEAGNKVCGFAAQDKTMILYQNFKYITYDSSYELSKVKFKEIENDYNWVNVYLSRDKSR